MVQVNLNQGDNAKRPKVRRYYLSKDIIKNYKVITNGKNLHQLIDSDIKLMKKEIRKLTTEKDGDYIAGWLLNYEYIKDHYILIAVDPSRQKELDSDPKAFQQVELARQLNYSDDGIIANVSIFVLRIF